jgi:opacity protein-like surface antigen
MRLARPLLVALCAAALAGAAASSSAAERSWVVQGDNVIGGYLVKKDGTLFGAIRQFGQPTSKRRDTTGWNGCSVTWKNLGLRIFFYNLGGHDSCQPQYGYSAMP